MDIVYTASSDIRKSVDEQSFKMTYIKEQAVLNSGKFFCIETESTLLGFPDVLYIENGSQKAKLLEFKFERNGALRFKPAQPAFYKRHLDLDISIIAYSPKTQKVYIFSADKLFNPESPYHMENCTVRIKENKNA